MKTIKLLTFILILGLLASCKPKRDDPEILKNILTEYFDGIRTQDLDKLNSLTTKNFVLFENGKIWTNDSLVTIKERYASFKGEWKLDSMKVNIDESSGDIVYFNHGIFIMNDTLKMEFDWLESATFRKVEGAWKLNFMHSTIRK